MTKRIIVGISGASGAIYGIRALELLRENAIETHLVMTKSAELTLHHELGMTASEVAEKATQVHSVRNVAASIASGSYVTDGMLIAPCSIRTMSEISTGVTSSLLTRAADVVLKEQRRLVLMIRETPLHTGHLRTMTRLSEIGAVIVPPVPAFYANPTTIDDVITQTVGRALDLFGLDIVEVRRWRD
mgnify:CR=1 FL=1